MHPLEKEIGYHFKNHDLLQLALTHPSLNGENNNQRLEFLGDAVLSLLVSDTLYSLYPGEPEGALARRQAALVCGPTLTMVATQIKLGEALKMSAGEIQMGGRDNPTNLEDALEALIGALYLDGGIKTASDFVTPRWKALAQTVEAPPKDAKTALQEWAQARRLPLPEYMLLDTRGSAHAPQFTIKLSVQGFEPLQAEANTKRKAEQLVADAFLKKHGNSHGV